MNTKKKALLFLIITIVVLVSVSVVTVTYAWFLSRYSENYDFELESDSHVVLRYESALVFASGEASADSNKIHVAKANVAAPLSQTVTPLAPMDVFDSTKVDVIANCVRFTATGAYWYGNGTGPGALSFALTATPQSNAGYDLVRYGELDYVVIFHYEGFDVLLFDGQYYTNSTSVKTTAGANLDLSGNTSLTLPSAANTFASADSQDPWYLIPANSSVALLFGEEWKEVFNNGLILLPNTQFAFTLYVFAAKEDDFVDPAWNGQTVSIQATLSVPNLNA